MKWLVMKNFPTQKRLRNSRQTKVAAVSWPVAAAVSYPAAIVSLLVIVRMRIYTVATREERN